jgi:Tetrapyrrole (Corrin/Porphyrin) Methylases
MALKPALEAAAAAATQLLKELGATRPPAGGSLTVVGTGIRAVTQLTLETLAEMADAEALLHVIGEPVQEEAVLAINPAARTLVGHYVEGLERSHTYEAMVQEILACVKEGKRTVAAFYGHPGVFTYPTHESVRRARALGYPARMLPAVSAEDCLFADLGLDPGDGCQSYEATDFLYRGPANPSAHLVLWQVGSIGNYTYESTGYDMSAFPVLVRKLRRTYPASHVVTIYEASFDPAGWARALRVPLDRLDAAQVTPASTLHIPPLAPRWRPAAPAGPRQAYPG